MPDQKIDAVIRVLDDLLNEDDILATMVKSRGAPAVSPPTSRFKIKNFAIWQLINASVDQSLALVDAFSNAGADKLYLEIAEYEIIFFVIDRGTVLVAVIPALANKGLLEVEIENARRVLRQLFRRG